MRTSSEQTHLLHQQQTYCDSVVFGNLIPTHEVNLGSATHKFNEVHVKQVFVGPSTIYLGTNSISTSDEGILLNGVNVVDRLKTFSNKLTIGATGEMLVSTGGGVQWQPINLAPGPTGPTGANTPIESALSNSDAAGQSLHNLSALNAGTSITDSIAVGGVALFPSGVESPSFTINSRLNVNSAEISSFNLTVGDHIVSTNSIDLFQGADKVSANCTGVQFTQSTDTLNLNTAENTLNVAADCVDFTAGPPANYSSINLNGVPYKLRLASSFM